MKKQEEPRCVDCGADDVTIDDDRLCQPCFTVRGFRTMAEMLSISKEPRFTGHAKTF